MREWKQELLKKVNDQSVKTRYWKQVLERWAYVVTDPAFSMPVASALVEHSSIVHLIRWVAIWMISGALCSFDKNDLKGFALCLALGNFVMCPVQHPFLAAGMQMKACMILLRIVIMLEDSEYFENLGPVFTSRYALAYHDIRRTTLITSKQQQIEISYRALKEISFGIFLTLCAQLLLFPSLQPFYLDFEEDTHWQYWMKAIIRSYIGAIRLWGLVLFSDAATSLQLSFFRLASPKCFDRPYLSTGIADFYGKRWNLANGSK
jgi:hypothetical protein